jgi:hypothetical protein
VFSADVVRVESMDGGYDLRLPGVLVCLTSDGSVSGDLSDII